MASMIWQFTGIWGPIRQNGAGMTTLFKMIGGVQAPDAGLDRVHGPERFAGRQVRSNVEAGDLRRRQRAEEAAHHSRTLSSGLP
jgi:ABC-type uncharacterized transport system ATPase subunit